jgi:hypothetical protein
MKPRCLVLDDLRTFAFPARYARTVATARRALAQGVFDELWLDHDLGPGQDVWQLVSWLEQRAAAGQPLVLTQVVIHSDNAPGAARLVSALERIYRVRRVDPRPLLAKPSGA